MRRIEAGAWLLLPVLLVLCLGVPDAFGAAGDDWTKPVTGLLDLLEGGLVKVATMIIGIMMVIYGVITVFSGQPNWMRLGTMVFGGVVIMFGPDIIQGLLSIV